MVIVISYKEYDGLKDANCDILRHYNERTYNFGVIVLMSLVKETRWINTTCNKGLFYSEYTLFSCRYRYNNGQFYFGCKLFSYSVSIVAIESRRMNNSKAAWVRDVFLCILCESGSCKENEFIISIRKLLDNAFCYICFCLMAHGFAKTVEASFIILIKCNSLSLLRSGSTSLVLSYVVSGTG